MQNETTLLPGAKASREAGAPQSLGKTLFHVAWMAILLGLILEMAILIVATTFNQAIAGKPVIADLVQKVSWSVIVCMGLALGRGAVRMQALSIQAPTMGLVGLLSGPLAFAIARSLHEGTQEALFIKVFQAGAGSPVLLALIKGIEYGCLGAALAWIGKQIWGRALAHAGAGFAIGAVFGAILIGLMLRDAAAKATLGAILSRAINEILNPVGCSLTLYAAEVMGRTTAATVED